jgi:mRNA interferase RelE/StbE
MWQVVYLPEARKELASLDRQVARRILRFIGERVIPAADPRSLGAPLHGPLRKYWKYRVGSHRVIAIIEDDIVTIVIVRIGPRSQVYR